MSKLQKQNGTLTTERNEILDLQANFYKKLYTSEKQNTKQETIQYLNKVDSPKLSEEEKLAVKEI